MFFQPATYVKHELKLPTSAEPQEWDDGEKVYICWVAFAFEFGLHSVVDLSASPYSVVNFLFSPILLADMESPQPESGCATSDTEALQDLAADRTNTLAAAMPETEQYSCLTQDHFMPTFGTAPVSHLNSQHGNHPSIVLGLDEIVPRWDIVLQPNRKLLYFIRKETFPDPDTTQRAESSFQAAAGEWNKVGFGLHFEATNNASAAHFYLLYSTASDEYYAKAFFPNELGQDIEVYPQGVDPQRPKDGLKKTFMHELGHILGLRHEFAVENQEKEASVQFMDRNPRSIMTYEKDRDLQESDKAGVKAFYKMHNGERINGVRIQDCTPVAKGAIPSKSGQHNVSGTRKR